MQTAGSIGVLLIAVLHAWFVVLEMVLWTKPRGRKTFGLDADFAQATKALAANQGLYNGFLVAGLVWGVVEASSAAPAVVRFGTAIETFFLVCVIVAGVFGALTVNRRILFVQALPAVLVLVLVRLAAGGGA